MQRHASNKNNGLIMVHSESFVLMHVVRFFSSFQTTFGLQCFTMSITKYKKKWYLVILNLCELLIYTLYRISINVNFGILLLLYITL